MNKVIISLAPVSAADTRVIPEEVAAEVVQAEKLGAAMVHLHVRDKTGKLTPDVTDFAETIGLIRKGSNLVIQASSGGISAMNMEQRCAPLFKCPLVEMTSLNGGSTNLGDAVYANSLPDVRYCATVAAEKRIVPEYEVFEIGMIHSICEIASQVDVSRPLLINTVFGHRGTMPATIDALVHFRHFVPKDALWGVTHFGRRGFDFLAAAIGMGADLVRIGFEDSKFLDPERRAENNLQLVDKLAALIRAMDREIATPDEARRMLNVQPKP